MSMKTNNPVTRTTVIGHAYSKWDTTECLNLRHLLDHNGRYYTVALAMQKYSAHNPEVPLGYSWCFKLLYDL